MLKKMYQKEGMIMVFNDNQTIDECYFMINQNHTRTYLKEEEKEEEKEKENDKKKYYSDKGFTYPLTN